MASRRDKKVADATTKLGRTIARALRSWTKEVGADDIASDVMDRVREGFDVVRDPPVPLEIAAVIDFLLVHPVETSVKNRSGPIDGQDTFGARV